MPIYQYKAVDGENRTKRGIVDADSPREARIKLRRESLFVTDLNETGKRGGKRFGLRGISGPVVPDKKRNEQVAAVTRQMASLLGSGIPLAETLRMVIEQAPDQKIEHTFRDIRERVTQGVGLGDAVLQHPAYFTDLYANMVKAGETSGALDKVMVRLAGFLQAQSRMRNKVGAAMVYPAIMVAVGAIVVVILLIFVVPKITRLLTARNQELPLPTKILVETSNFLGTYWFLLLVAILLVMIVFNLVTGTEKGRYQWDKLKLSLPVFGDLMRKQSVARFSTTLATLLRSGVPALQALEVTKNVLGNKVLDKALTTVHDHVLEGTDIATPMKMTGTFPPMVCYMVGVGEQAGNLEEMLERVASSYDEEVELATAKMTSLLEPLIIVGLAVVVGFIVIAIVLPLLKLQNVK